MEGIASRYDTLARLREPYLKRAREVALLTLPYIMPPEGWNETQTLPTPQQSVGADGIKNLSNKFVSSLFPVGRPFFKHDLSEFHKEQLKDTKAIEAVSKALAQRDRAINGETEKVQARSSLFETFKNMLVSGNYLINIGDGGKVKGYRLDSYVVDRDPDGKIEEIIVRESVDRDSLPPEVVAFQSGSGISTPGSDNDIFVYTHIQLDRERDQYVVGQYANDILIPGTDGGYKAADLPWLALRHIKIDGENYGRGLGEEHLGDLNTVEEMTKAIRLSAGIAVKVLLFVRPNGQTKIKSVTTAKSGAVISGNAADVTSLDLNKQADMQIAQSMLKETEQRLQRTFLMFAAVQRDAERVTAEEIRMAAVELETAHGGAFSMYARDLQLSYLMLVIKDMIRRKVMVALPDALGDLEPVIVTGMDALGRGQELNKFLSWLDIMSKFPDFVAALDIRAIAKFVGDQLGVDIEGFLKSAEDIQQEQQLAMIQQIAAQGGGALAEGAAQAATAPA